jgi:hypothetical protein
MSVLFSERFAHDTRASSVVVNKEERSINFFVPSHVIHNLCSILFYLFKDNFSKVNTELNGVAPSVLL